MIFRPVNNTGSSGNDTCQGERYIPAMTPEDYSVFRTHEKGYCMLALILHSAVGILPAIGLSFTAAAAFYAFTLVLLVRQTWGIYHRPNVPEPLSYEACLKAQRRALLFSGTTRLLVVLTLAFALLPVWRYHLEFSFWVIPQVILLLATALVLQKLYRLQRTLTFDVTTN